MWSGGRIILLGLAAAVATSSGARAGAWAGAWDAPACDIRTTPAGFDAALEAAVDGQTVCLASGDYGIWRGTEKQITITAQPDADPQMRINLGATATGFTLDGLSGMGGRVTSGAHDFTIRDSVFTAPLDVEATDAAIVLDHNTHSWDAVYDGAVNAKIFVWNDTGSFSGVTVQNSTIRGGDLDGVHAGGGAGLNIVGNTFLDLCDQGSNHTDNIQFEGAEGGVIARNYIQADPGCLTQGITSYDGGTHGLVIEDNVVDIRRPWGIELYSDRDSVVRHNTLPWYAKTACSLNSTCGRIDIDRKPEDPAGSGTQVYDNLATSVEFTNGSTGSEHDNVNPQRASFVGPLDVYAGYRLAPDSPVGLLAASDGLDSGARMPALEPTPTPTASATATASPVGTATAAPNPTAPATAVPSATPSAVAARVTPPPAPADPVSAFDFDRTVPGSLHKARRVAGGRHGAALALTGDGYARVPDSESLRLGTDMTLEAWVRPTAAGRRWRAVVAKPRAGGPGYALYANDGRGHVAARIGGVTVRGRTRLPLRRWSHVAATYDGRALRVFLDGRRQGSVAMTGLIRSGSGPLLIGQGFAGRIDDVRIWRTALSAATLRRHATS